MHTSDLFPALPLFSHHCQSPLLWLHSPLEHRAQVSGDRHFYLPPQAALLRPRMSQADSTASPTCPEHT